MQNLSGRKLGNYELRERLGRGGMAEVYKAYQPSMDRFVAVKVMLGHLATDDSFIERFKREAQAVGKLRHQHIIHIFDFGIQDDMYYMAMEFLTDGDLKQYINTHKKLPIADSLKITRDLADALDYAHKQGMIHRDLKPANVMFVDKEKLNVVLTDFGIARILDATGLTGTGMAVGTPAYMSPEAGSGEDTDERADIYALGIIMYEMLVGKAPYNADTPLAVIMKHISAPLPTRAEYGDDIPAEVEGIMLKCLAKDPEDRFASGGELRDALDNILPRAANIAKTESLAPKSVDTRVSENNKAPSIVTSPDAPTTTIDTADTVPDPPIKPESASKQNNSMMMYGIAAIIAIVVIGGLLAFFNNGSSSNDDKILVEASETNIAQVVEASEEVSESPQATDVPDETEVSEATDVPDDIETPPDDENDIVLNLGGEMPPHPANLSLFSNINEVLNEAEVFVLDGDLDAAKDYVEGILDNDPENLDAIFARSQLYNQDWDDENIAGEEAERLIELDPDSPWGYVALSDSWLNYPAAGEDGSFEAALAAIEQAAELDPDNPQVLYRLSVLGEWEESFERMDTAEADGASGYRFMWFISNDLYESGQYNRAIPYYETIYNYVSQDEYDTEQTMWALVGSLIQVERAVDGLTIVNESGILDSSTDFESYIEGAWTAFQAGDLEQAKEWANTALAFEPEAHGASYILGLLAFRMDEDIDAAMEILDSLEDEEVFSRFLNFRFGVDLNIDRARLLRDAGRLDEALTFYNVAIEAYSFTPWVYEERADLHIQLENIDAAREDLQFALENTGDDEYRAYLRDRILDLGSSSE